MAKRSNQKWLEMLRGPQREQALADLRALLMRGLRAALAGHRKITEGDLDDFVQDALVRILDALDSFRGESRFTTWAHKIAIRVALTELRRRRWRDDVHLRRKVTDQRVFPLHRHPGVPGRTGGEPDADRASHLCQYLHPEPTH